MSQKIIESTSFNISINQKDFGDMIMSKVKTKEQGKPKSTSVKSEDGSELDLNIYKTPVVRVNGFYEKCGFDLHSFKLP